MRKTCLLALLFTVPAWGAVETTRIQGKVIAPDGSAVTGGKIVCELSTQASALDPALGQMVRIGSRYAAAISATGEVDFTLVPNDVTTPETTYSCRLSISGPAAASWTETWLVASSPDPIAIGAVERVDQVPSLEHFVRRVSMAARLASTCSGTEVVVEAETGRVFSCCEGNWCLKTWIEWIYSGSPCYADGELGWDTDYGVLRVCAGGSWVVANSAVDRSDGSWSTGPLAFVHQASGLVSFDSLFYLDRTNLRMSVPSICLDSDGTGCDGTLTATAYSGNASTATALAANPADCPANQFANANAANGDLTCSAIADADVPNTITIELATAATTAKGIKAADAGTGIPGDLNGDGSNELVMRHGYIDIDMNQDGTNEQRILGDYDNDGSFEFVDDICAGIQNFCDPDADDTQENRGSVDLDGDNTADPYCGTVSILPGIYSTASGKRTCTIDYGGLTVKGMGEGPTIDASGIACSELDGGNNMTIFWFTDNSTDGTFSALGLSVENINLEGPGSREENDSSCDMNGTPSGHCTSNWCPENAGYGTRVIGMVVQGYRQVQLRNNRVSDMDAQGMGVENCEDVIMTGNHVKHAGEHCFLSTRTDGLVFSNNIGETCGLSTAGDCFYWSNRDYMSPKNNSMTGNVCTNSQIGFRFETFAGGVGAYSATITGNIFEGPGVASTSGTPSYGIGMVMESGSSMKDVVIANNVVAKFPEGCFWLNPATAADVRSFLIENNTFSDCSSTSCEVLLEGDDITFRGNTITDTDGDSTIANYGVWMRGGDRLTIEGNDIRGFASQGIRLDSSQSTTTDTRILNNRIVANKTSSQNTGVYIATGVTSPEVSGNEVWVESIDYTGDGTVDTATLAQGISTVVPTVILGNVVRDTATAGINVETAESAGTQVIGNVIKASAGYCVRALTAGPGNTYLSNYCTGANQNDAPFEENTATNGLWWGNVYSGIYGSTAPVSYQTGSGGETLVADFNRDGTLNDPVLLQGGTLIKVIEQNLVTPKYRSTGTTIAAAGPWYSSAGCGSTECWVHDFDGDATIDTDGTDYCVLAAGSDYNCDGTADYAVVTTTVDDDGTAEQKATATITPKTRLHTITCSDADGCTITLGETGVKSGSVVTLICLTANNCEIDDAAGVADLSADPLILADINDSVTVAYMTNTWVQIGSADLTP